MPSLLSPPDHPTRTTRLATLPASHAYVDAVVPAGVERVDVGTVADGWTPEPSWEPVTWEAQAAGVDVVHVHFGFDHVPPRVLREWVAVTRRHRVRLVVTVHDLRNPHQRDRAVLDAQWTVLLAAADAVFTLTPGAAAEIAARFGRRATVVPHPAVFDGPPAVRREPGLVGVHLKSFRTNLGEDVVPGLTAVATAVARAGGRLEVDVHTDVADDRRTADVAAALAGRPEARLRVHDRFDDDELHRYLGRLSVSVQLHRWGTHSGWVEACHDVGTAVVAPDVGFVHEQWDAVVRYAADETTGPDVETLRAAVTGALAAPAPAPADRAWRRAQAARVRAAHLRVYSA